MKNKIFRFLIQTGIVKNGYINPFLLWSFLLLTPMVTYSLYHKEEELKTYSSDEQLIGMILKEYEDNGEILVESKNEISVVGAENKPEKKLIKTELNPIKNKTKVVVKDNLFSLMQKAKKDKGGLTPWDNFRLAVYQTSINIKKKYPTIGGTPEQIYDWSMKTFYQESGYKKDAQNPHSSAYGLFQAMASTRKSLNMPKGLSLIAQLPYYEKYICGQINSQKLDVSKINTPLDWYLIVFYPNLSDKNDHIVFARCGGHHKKYCTKRGGWKKCNYHANAGYDLNKDAIIYKWEIGKHLIGKY